MKWPDEPTCHNISPVFRYSVPKWERRNILYTETPEIFRRCSYCGSIHPEDLIRVLSEDAKLEGSDWKYGWPHKFYVEEIPCPLKGREVQVGFHSFIQNDVRIEEPIMGVHQWDSAKWYNEHLEDEGYDEEALSLLLFTLKEHSGIDFSFEERDGKQVLRYAAPYGGYQH